MAVKKKVAKKTLNALKKPELSDIPSKALRQALADLEEVERLKDIYVIDMSLYHEQDDGKCNVCFAGAVIALAGNDPRRKINPESFDSKTHDKLRGIDCFRGGEIGEGINFFRLKKVPLILNSDYWSQVDVADYHESPKKFKQDMNEIADSFEKLGI